MAMGMPCPSDPVDASTPRHALMADVTAEAAAVLAVGEQLLHRKEAAFRQRRIDARARVALAQEQPVAAGHARIVGVVAQYVGIEHGHQIRHGKDAGDVRGAPAAGHLQRVKADLVGQIQTLLAVHRLPPCRAGISRRADGSLLRFFFSTHKSVSQNTFASSPKDWLRA